MKRIDQRAFEVAVISPRNYFGKIALLSTNSAIMGWSSVYSIVGKYCSSNTGVSMCVGAHSFSVAVE